MPLSLELHLRSPASSPPAADRLTRPCSAPRHPASRPGPGAPPLVMPAYNETVRAHRRRARRRCGGGLGRTALAAGSTCSSCPIPPTPSSASRRRRPISDPPPALAGAAVYYRRRRKNIARKPGNIADWCGAAAAPTTTSWCLTPTASWRARHRCCRLDGDDAAPGIVAVADRAAAAGRADAVVAAPAVRRPGLRRLTRHRPRLVARQRGQLLGPQRDDPHGRLRRSRGPAACCRAGRPSAGTSSATISSRPP